MPCLEITLPKVDNETKEKLSAELTRVFEETTNFGAEIFGLRFFEYEPYQAASGGVVWDGRSGRPYLHMLFYCPRLERATKQEVVKQFTSAFVSVVGKENWLPVIHICEHPYDNVGVEGELLSDAYEACAESKFYYPMNENE